MFCRELLEKIAEFEDMEFAGTKKKDLGFSSRLEPINDGGGSALLNMVGGPHCGLLIYRF